MKIKVPAPLRVPIGLGKDGLPVEVEMTFADFLAAWVFPFCGGGAKEAFRNARLYDQANTQDALEIPDQFFVEIRNALNTKDLNQSMAFRLIPFLQVFVEGE